MYKHKTEIKLPIGTIVEFTLKTITLNLRVIFTFYSVWSAAYLLCVKKL